MEFRPIESFKQVPPRLAAGIRELREVIIGPVPTELTNEDFSKAEESAFYRTANHRNPYMSGRLSLEAERQRSRDVR